MGSRGIQNRMRNLACRRVRALSHSVSAPAFSPTDIAGLAYWFKADALVGYSQNDTVTSLPDSSGNGLDATKASGDPTYQPNQQNGKPAVVIDSAINNIGCFETGAWAVAQPQTVYMALKLDTTPNNARTLLSGSGSDKMRFYIDGSDLTLYAGSATDPKITSLANAWCIITGVFNGASSLIAKNGDADVTGNPGTGSATSKIQINGSAGGNELDKVSWGEILVYAGAHDAGQRSNVVNYLNSRWAIY